LAGPAQRPGYRRRPRPLPPPHLARSATGSALRTSAQTTIMQFSLGLRWLPCIKRVGQAGRSAPISLSPWWSACSSATLRECPPAITGCRPLRRLSRAPATRLPRRRGCNGTTGGTKPCGRSVKRTTGTGHL